ncbi:endonuclease/exonuclease/phosphatase family protein [Actinomycetospora straminea]|uniref:Endonuclease/exonuclease/phosphatase family protein n=1 Tax=Actinomycetospora straminea TaxID=663607 RepID=A0ABP9DYA2_9PSEU|nr:endonuclease/exonuclease/phosphatase family protein [Actinomycetospora straminea]MDD7930931.1 endonuclease/exonuclease/phosphatase family protein [Actinomycetospora straminea]
MRRSPGRGSGAVLGAARRRFGAPGPAAIGAAVVLGLPAAVVMFSDLLGIDHRTPFVQTIAFRPQLATATVVFAVLVAVVARRAWPTALALGLVGVLGLAMVLPRAVGSGATGATGGPELTVLTASTYLSRADPDALAGLIAARTPDVVVLPEARGELRASLQEALVDESGGEEGTSGYRVFAADADRDDSPMTVFVRRELGRPTVTPNRDTEFPSLIVELADVDGRPVRVVATHPQSPRPGETGDWRRDVAALARWCTGDRPTVVAGDLNATLDHAELREAIEGCTDAASDVGAGLMGTWPSAAPRLLGVQIDHVLVSGGPTAREVDIVDVPGSDHRGILARVGLG